MGPVGPRAELGVELDADHEGRAIVLHDLDKPAVGGEACGPHADLLESLPVGVADLVPVAVPLVDHAVGPVGAGRRRVGHELAGVCAEPHGAAHVRDSALVGHQVDDRVRGAGVELGGVGVGEAHEGARGLDDHDLHSEAQSQVGHLVGAGILDGFDHALDSPLPEAARNDDAHGVGQVSFRAVPLDLFGGHPAQVDAAVVGEAGVGQGLAHGEVRVGQLDVLADDGYGEHVVQPVHPVDHAAPVVEIPGNAPQAEGFDHQAAEPLLLQDERDLVDAIDGREGDDALPGHVAVDGDLVLDVVLHGVVAPADDGVGLDADAAQLPDAVLGGLGLELARCPYIRKVGDVDVVDVVAPDLVPHLPDGFQEGQSLDVADGAAHLRDYHAGPALAGQPADALLDGVGDVGHGLDGPAEELALPLAGYDVAVDLAGGHVRQLGKVYVDEPLVVAQVEVGLAAVVGDEDLAVLVGRHGAGVDVQVRVELEHGYGEAAALEDAPQGRDGYALADGADDAARDEYEGGHRRPSLTAQAGRTRGTAGMIGGDFGRRFGQGLARGLAGLRGSI